MVLKLLMLYYVKNNGMICNNLGKFGFSKVDACRTNILRESC